MANDPLNAGETLFVGAMPTDPVWDTSLKGGAGGLRSRTAQEVAAITAANTAAQAQLANDIAALKANYATIQGWIATPATAPTTLVALETALFPFLARLLRVLNVVVDDEQQQP